MTHALPLATGILFGLAAWLGWRWRPTPAGNPETLMSQVTGIGLWAIAAFWLGASAAAIAYHLGL